MKKGTIIAIVVLVALVAIFFATREAPQTTVGTPFVVKPVENLNRIELTRPGESGAELVVFEKKEEGWTLARPVEAPLADEVKVLIDEAFGTPIRTDDLRIPTDKAADYGLSESDAVKVALFKEGSSEPAASLAVGKEVVIETTRAQRSFIAANDSKLYRAQKSLEFLRRPISDLRSKSIFAYDRSTLSEFVIEGPAGRLRIFMGKDDWEVEGEDFKLEKSVINGFAASMSNLNALDFVDDGKAEDLGLEPAQYRVTAKFGENVARLALGQVGETTYARAGGGRFIYTIPRLAADNLMLTPLKVRSRLTQDFLVDDIQTIEFAGTDRVILTKDNEDWRMLRPERKVVTAEQAAAFIGAVAALRATRYVDISATEAGLEASRSRVIVRGKETLELILGNTVPETEDVYAKWKHRDVVFIVPKYLRDRLMPSVTDFKTSEP